MASKTEQRKIQIIADGSSVNASMEQMTKATSVLWSELKKLTPGSEEFIKKSKEFQEVKSRLNETKVAANGTTKSLNEMANEALAMSPIGGIINTITGAMGKARVGVNLVTTSFHTLKGAIAATGIGLLVLSLGLLINYLTSTQAGIDKVNKVLTPMKVIFEKLQGVVQNLGGNLFKGLGEMLNGNVSKGFSSITNGAKQAGDELGKAFTDGIKQGGELADMNIKIEQTEIALTEARSVLNNKYQEAMEIAKDQSKSEEQRRAAAKSAQALENELLDKEQEFIDMKIEKLKLEQTFNDTSREGYLELANLEAERTDFETQASKRRTKARSLENTITEEIATEQNKKSAERTKQEEENIKRLSQLRTEYLKASLDLETQLEDMLINLMDEGLSKKTAKLELDLEREIAALDEKRIKILENETLTAEEKIKIQEQFTDLEEMIRQENRQKKADLEEKEKEDELEKKLDDFDAEQEIEMLQLENSMIGAIDAEMRKKEALLQIQKQYALEKLALLEAAGDGETIQALKLKNIIGKIDQEIADGKITEAQRAEEYKRQIQSVGLETAREFMQLGLDLLAEDSKARKVAALAMKAFEIGLVVTSGIREIQGYWASNAGIPIIGPGLATALSIAAGVRTLGAVNKIRTAKYATGGQTGSGNMIDMMMGRDGAWRMPNGQGTRNVGTFKNGGHIGSASFGVIGEAGSEWVGPNWMMRSPKYANIFGYLEAERKRATPFASGGSTGSAPQIPQNSSATADLQQSLAMIEQFGDMSAKFDTMISILQQWPDRLRVYNDPRDIRSGVRVLNEIEADSRINR